jgi:hypothetical protein
MGLVGSVQEPVVVGKTTVRPIRLLGEGAWSRVRGSGGSVATAAGEG